MPVHDVHYDDMSPEELTAFNKILAVLHQRCGADFRQYRPNCLRRRVTVRVQDTHRGTLASYLEYLVAHPEECDLLRDRITINVSEFFRNAETFAAVVQSVFPDLLARAQTAGSRTLRVWSAGCATGEEPYSLAMLFQEFMTKHRAAVAWKIFATDIDKDAMRVAQTGCYDSRHLKGVSPERVRQFFVPQPKGIYQVSPALAERIKFIPHNMISAPPLTNIDMIFCRNVVIYFSRQLQEKVYENFYRALVPGGYMVAGKVETLIGTGERLFQRVNAEERIFRKKQAEGGA